MADDIRLQVGVKAFLKNPEGKFLLLKRNPIKYASVQGSWDIVGGRINPGTPLAENLKREIYEETGLTLSSIPKLVHVQDILNRPDKHVVRVSYVADISGEPILDTSENIEHGWFTLDQMRKISDLDIYVKEIVERNLI